MLNMLTKLRSSTVGAALRMGGFIGWYLTVMYICEQSLRFYRDDTMFSAVNVIFLVSALIAAAVLAILLLLFDIEGLLADKILRWLPGIFMAESGIALSLANASTMTLFASAAGVASALGALAVLTQLLRVKVGKRVTAICSGLAIGGLIRLIAILILGDTATKTSLMAVAIGIGVIAALTVHSEGYSTSDGSPLVSLAEAGPRTMIKRIPGIFAALFLCSAAFYFAHSHIETLAINRITEFDSTYAVVASLGFIAVSAAAALTFKFTWLPMLFVFGTGFSAAAAMLAGLPYMTGRESAVFAFLSYAALACVKACFYGMIIIFSLDRPHPLFYAFFGYAAAIGGQTAGIALDRAVKGGTLAFYIGILLLLLPLGGGAIAYGMSRCGFTREKLDHRHNVRAAILRAGNELELSPRERQMTESIVLDGCGVEELANKMLFSRNTVRVLLRSLLPKFGVDSIDSLRAHFDKLAVNDEKFMADVQAAEADRRAADKAEQSQHRKEEREHRREARAEKKAAEEREFAEKAATMQMMEIILGGDDGEDIPEEYSEEECSDETDFDEPEEEAEDAEYLDNEPEDSEYPDESDSDDEEYPEEPDHDYSDEEETDDEEEEDSEDDEDYSDDEEASSEDDEPDWD